MNRAQASRLIEQEIARFGPMTFRRFVELALYHPAYGYYHRAAPQRGRTGDYFTAPQASPLFGRIIADALLAARQEMQAEQLTLVEWGAGDGELLEAVLTRLGERKAMGGVRVVAIEKSRSARERLWRRLSRFPKCQVVADADDIDYWGTGDGFILANEFFDAFPFHRVRVSGGTWREVYVGVEGGAFREEEGPLSDAGLAAYLEEIDMPRVEGREVELRPQVRDWYAAWSSIFTRGYTMVFDYGYARAALHGAGMETGTMATYSRHATGGSPLDGVGEQDITAHVDFTDVATAGRRAGWEPVFFSTQGVFLSHAGADTINGWLAGGAPSSQRPAAAVQQLLHPGAMGDRFSVLIQALNAPLPACLADAPNRIGRLLSTG